MPDLPEITILARDMQKELVGRTIAGVEVLQPKSLNVPETGFQAALTGAEICAVAARGKCVPVHLSQMGVSPDP